MKLLALDTSTSTGSAAVLIDGVLASEVTARNREAHSALALPLVEQALSLAGLALADIEMIAAGIGPGSFTGVRIGLSTAKGLCLARGLTLRGVGSLDALARAADNRDGYVFTALDARRDELYAALWRYEAGTRSLVIEGLHAKPESLAEKVAAVVGEAHCHVQTDADATLRQRLVAAAPSVGWHFASPLVGTPLARFVAQAALDGTALLDDGTLEPTYLRPSDAKLPAQRQRPV